jgi:hypothetical protein
MAPGAHRALRERAADALRRSPQGVDKRASVLVSLLIWAFLSLLLWAGVALVVQIV